MIFLVTSTGDSARQSGRFAGTIPLHDSTRPSTSDLPRRSIWVLAHEASLHAGFLGSAEMKAGYRGIYGANPIERWEGTRLRERPTLTNDRHKRRRFASCQLKKY